MILLFPLYSICNLVAGTVSLILGTITMIKIYFGSKSTFAYILMLFTILIALDRILLFFIYAYPHEYIIDGNTDYVTNFRC